jgi:hypothetical protein
MIRDRTRDLVPADMGMNDQRKAVAIYFYILAKKVNQRPCKQYQHMKSKGPGAECIAGGPDILAGSCTN